MVDDFETVEGWSALPADGVELAIRSDAGYRGRAMRLDFAFTGGGGYAVARKALSLHLPENYAFSFRIRGEAAPNHLEFKLVDASGENVWWSVKRDVDFPAEWEVFVIKKRHIAFAWGPRGGGEIREVAAIELAVTAGGGGRGSVWIDELELTTLPPPDEAPPAPVASASSARRGHEAARVLDGDPATAWRPAAADTAPWLALDLGGAREFGGLVLDWEAGREATDYAIEVAGDDAPGWRRLRAVERSRRARSYLYLPESEARHLRVRVARARGDGPALRALTVEPLAWAASREAFFQAVARDAPRGAYPRAIAGEQSYWTVVGVGGDARESLFGEDGAIEAGEDHVSIEPFLAAGGRLLTWNDARVGQSLDEGPAVTWEVGDLRLRITASAAGEPGASSVVVSYSVENRGGEQLPVTLYLAVRPFQVNPPSQALNRPGGAAPIRELAFEGRTVRVNGQVAAVSASAPAAAGAAAFDEGDVVADYLVLGALPPAVSAADPFAAASGALAYRLEVAPGSTAEVKLSLPLHPGSPPEAGLASAAPRPAPARRVTIRIPAAERAVASLWSQLDYILINRAGPAIQPGARAYARSWIRDGSLTSTALLRLGHADEVRAFIEWFAPHQYENGKVPCVVDRRGADPVPEHDSTGELIYLIAEYYRHTGDRALIGRLWPRVARAAAYLDSLRRERRTAEYEEPAKRRFYGLLPPSISHEGYSAKPMHSYWDDFFALRGFKDAGFLAGELGRVDDQGRLGAIRDEFAQDLGASVEAARREHGIDYIPGSADLGDFDATSTTIALSPAAAAGILDPAALARTFERYYAFFRARRDGEPWEAFTPYEMRNIGAFVRLGWRDRAHELLDFFLSSQRPAGWRQWPEVVWRDARAPHFLGDLPHTWVGSDYVRSFLDLLAYERESDGALVVGAGVPMAWLAPAAGVEVEGLGTHHGPLAYAMRRAGEGVLVQIAGRGLRLPAGGIAVRAPLERVREATVNGRGVEPAAGGEVVVRELPAEVVLRP